MGIRILVIEDEPPIADFLVRGLREEGFTVEHAAEGESAWHALRGSGWDVVLLDWWPPTIDGLTLLRRYRQAGHTMPVLFLTARDAVSDRVRGLTLLFLARADAEANAPPLGPLDLRAWLTEHLAAWSGHARAGDVCLEPAGEGPLWVQAQAPLLGQLLDNLLENAGKYSAAGTPITVSATTETDGVCLSVADSGCGITAEDLPCIFEPFYRSQQARAQGVAGTGLGLAVAQRIAVALGGVLQAYSRPGQGARFTLRLSVPRSPGQCG